ncbi:MAG: PepSY domain-containing protein [Rickettsiales bacterium]|nr:PepSY domain-containing protein [Rickettsiales bacterium]
MDKKPRRKMGWRLRVLRWHRQIGLAASLLMVLLAVTGIILNHNSALELQHQEISSEWLMNWYDIDPAQVAEGYTAPLSLDRVMLDLHTGSFFGSYGTIMMDAAAIILLLLTFTGIYNWYRSPRRMKK